MKKINTTDLELSKVQDYAAQAIEPIERVVMLRGAKISGVVITAGFITAVPHGLAREPEGFFLTDINAGATVWRSESKLPKRFINLNASADCTVDVWVY